MCCLEFSLIQTESLRNFGVLGSSSAPARVTPSIGYYSKLRHIFITVALTATIHNLKVELSDIDRSVYEQFDLRIARHPSETLEYMLTRVLAYCLEYAD